jgi:septal ring factor EnvC (AmiA/AmiB activator)
MMSLFESQFVGGDEDRPAKLLEFLDHVESRVISSNSQNSENIFNHLTDSSQKIDRLTSLIKKEDDENAALIKDLDESEEKQEQVSEADNDTRHAEELLQTPPANAAPEESKTEEIANVPIPEPVLPVSSLEDDSSKSLRTPEHRKMVI